MYFLDRISKISCLFRIFWFFNLI